MAREVVVPGGLSTRSAGTSARISASIVVEVSESDSPIRVYVVKRSLQRPRTRVWTVTILDPPILKVRLQLGDVVVCL